MSNLLVSIIIIAAIIVFIKYKLTASNKLVDKERELTVKLGEQSKKTAELEQKYDSSKKNFSDMVGDFQRAKQRDSERTKL